MVMVSGSGTLARLLIAHGAWLWARDLKGRTAMEIANEVSWDLCLCCNLWFHSFVCLFVCLAFFPHHCQHAFVGITVCGDCNSFAAIDRIWQFKNLVLDVRIYIYMTCISSTIEIY
jgi:hypothetical protein